MIFKLESGNQIEVTCWNIKIVMARHALPLQIIRLIGRFCFKKLKCYENVEIFRMMNDGEESLTSKEKFTTHTEVIK